MPRSVHFPVSFAFRLTNEDADRLRMIADMRGMKPAELARLIVSRDIGLPFERRAVQRHVRHGEALRALLTELWRQGNNVNQVARVLNTSGVIDAGDPVLAALPGIEAALRRIERAILDAIGSADPSRL